MIMSRHGAAGACGGPASLLALLRRREALARTPRLGRRRRALRPRRALRRALRRRRRRRLRRGLRRRLRLGSGRSLLALRLRELLADDDDHLRTNGGAGVQRAVGQGSAHARWDRGSARSRAAAADGERCARVCVCVEVAREVCICAFGRATRCAVWRPGAARGLGARPRTAMRTTTGTSGFTNDTIVSSCGAQREWAREPCEAAVARAGARMGPRARAPWSPAGSAPRRTP